MFYTHLTTSGSALEIPDPLAHWPPKAGGSDLNNPDPLGWVLYRHKIGRGSSLSLIGGGVVIALPGLFLFCADSIWTWVLAGAAVLLGSLIGGPGLCLLVRGSTVCTFHERGARRVRPDSHVDQLRYEDAVEIGFSITRLFVNGGYTVTTQELRLGSGREGEELFAVSHRLHENTGLVTNYRVQHGLEPLCHHIAGRIAERLRVRLDRGEPVRWTNALPIRRKGLEISGADYQYVPWEQVARLEIEQGTFKLWLVDEARPRLEMAAGTMNFYPGYFLTAALVQENAGKRPSPAATAPQGEEAPAAGSALPRLVVSYANLVDDFMAMRHFEYQTDRAKRQQWLAKVWALPGLVTIPGIILFWALSYKGQLAPELCILGGLGSVLAGLLSRWLGGEFLWLLERNQVARELQAAHDWSRRQACPDPFLQREVAFLDDGIVIRTSADTSRWLWGQIGAIEWFIGYAFIFGADNKLNRPVCLLMIPPRAFADLATACHVLEFLRA
jgi:hypothetical protein